MSKKLLGERQLGDVVYTTGQILSDEDFAKSGLKDSDVVAVGNVQAAAPAQETAAAPADKDAEVDAQASGGEAKQEVEQSAQVGSEAAASADSSAGGASSSEAAKTDEAQAETVEHVLTEQDLLDNPTLVAEGKKVGDTVQVKKPAEAAAQ